MYNGGLHMGITVVTTALIYIFLIEGNPIPVFWRALTSRTFGVYLAIMLSVIGVNALELRLENSLPHLVPWDFTQAFYHLEGNSTEILQRALHRLAITDVAAFFYIIVFPVLVWATMAVFNRHDDKNMMKKLLLVFVLNYLIALPFYVLFPVNEVWSTKIGVEPLITQVYPAFETQYRALSGLNNCFPSLHTSLSVSLALLCIHSGYRRMAWVTAVSSMIIVFSTLYLGIHWITDVTGGLAVAALVVNLAIVWVDGPIPVYEKFKRKLNFLISR